MAVTDGLCRRAVSRHFLTQFCGATSIANCSITWGVRDAQRSRAHLLWITTTSGSSVCMNACRGTAVEPLNQKRALLFRVAGRGASIPAKLVANPAVPPLRHRRRWPLAAGMAVPAYSAALFADSDARSG